MQKIIIIFSTLLMLACSNKSQITISADIKNKNDSQNKKELKINPKNYDYSESYGDYPTDYSVSIKNYFQTILHDASSAKYAQISKPRKEHMMSNQKIIFGYSSCVLIDAKNDFGNYTGYQLYWVFFKNGEIIRHQNISTGPRVIYIGRTVNCKDGD